MVDPPPQPSAGFTLTDHTKVINAQSDENTVSVSKDMIVFQEGSEQINQIEVGDILVSDISANAPQGYLRRVNEIEINGGEYSITTEPATLTDAIVNADGSFRYTYTLADTLNVGGRSDFDQSFSEVLIDLDDNLSTTNDQLRLEGSFLIEPTVTFDIQIQRRSITYLKMGTVVSSTNSLALIGNIDYSFESEKEVYRHPLKPISFLIGGVFPVVITNDFVVKIGANGQLTAEFHTSYTEETFTEAYVEYDDGAWNSVYSKTQENTIVPFEATADADIKGYLQGGFDLRLYGSEFLTSQIYVEPYLYANASYSSIDDQFQYQIKAGISGKADINLELLGDLIQQQYSATLFDECIVLLEGESNPPPQPSGLIAHYPFNGNAEDESGNQNHGVVFGASLTEDRYGNPNSAFYFDGVDDYIEIADDELLDLTAPFSIVTWVKTPFTPNEKVIIGKGEELPYTIGIRLDRYWFKTGNVSQSFINMSSTTVPNDSWKLLVGTYDGSTMRFYVDGILEAEEPLTAQLANDNNPLNIGRRPLNIGSSYVEGKIDDIRIYDNALSTQEISELYQSEKPEGQNLVAYLPFNNNADDLSGRSNHGSVFGASFITDQNGNSNSAIEFDGMDDYVRIPINDDLNFGTNDWTVSVLVKTTSNKEGVIFGTRNTSACSQAFGPSVTLIYHGEADGTLTMITANQSEIKNPTKSEVVINDGNWHEVTVSRTDNLITLMVDGNQVTNEIAVGEDLSTTEDLYLGRNIYCSGNYFEGAIDEFKYEKPEIVG